MNMVDPGLNACASTEWEKSDLLIHVRKNSYTGAAPTNLTLCLTASRLANKVCAQEKLIKDHTIKYKIEYTMHRPVISIH